MRRQRLAGTELEPSVLCLGTGSFGSAIPRDTAFAILDAFAERGGTSLDTAHVYAAWVPGGAGASELTLGAWMRDRGVRQSMVVGTKGGHPDVAAMHVPRLTPAEIRRDLDESLERLQTETVDLYWLHRDDPSVPVAEILDVLNAAVAAGQVRALGASNWSVGRLEGAAACARRQGWRGFCASQVGWSFADIVPEFNGQNGMLYMDAASLRFHQRTQLPVAAYSSQAHGFFSGKYRREDALGAPLPAGVLRGYGTPANFDRLERAQALAARHGSTANAVALAWLLAQPFPVFPIVGPRTMAQLVDSCAATELTLAPAELAFLTTGAALPQP